MKPINLMQEFYGGLHCTREEYLRAQHEKARHSTVLKIYVLYPMENKPVNNIDGDGSPLYGYRKTINDAWNYTRALGNNEAHLDAYLFHKDNINAALAPLEQMLRDNDQDHLLDAINNSPYMYVDLDMQHMKEDIEKYVDSIREEHSKFRSKSYIRLPDGKRIDNKDKS